MVGVIPKSHKSKHVEVIRTWIDQCLHGGGIDRYDDLHVDQIDPQWKKKETWVSAAKEVFCISTHERDQVESESNIRIVLCVPLVSDEAPMGVTFKNGEDLERELSYTPPSLYMFRRGMEFWNEFKSADLASTELSPRIETLNAGSFFGPLDRNVECVFLEHKRPDDDDFSRTLFLAG